MPRFLRFFRYCTSSTLRQTIVAARQQRLPGLAAEMAYNAMLAFFPSILAVLTAIGLFQPLKQTFRQLAEQVSEVSPTEALWLIESFAEDISTSRDSSLFSLSFVLALWAASGALSAAMVALDQIHQVPPPLKRPFWKARLIAIGLTIGALLLLLLALTLIFVSNIVVRNVAEQSSWLESELLILWRWLTWPLVLGVMSVLFAFIYRFGPSRWIHGKPLLPGAVLAAISWAIVSNGLRLVVQQFGRQSQIYGVVGAVTVLLLWLYTSSLVLLIGDQLNVTIGTVMIRDREKRRLMTSQTVENEMP